MRLPAWLRRWLRIESPSEWFGWGLIGVYVDETSGWLAERLDESDLDLSSPDPDEGSIGQVG
jgi:hypothetical protein